MRLALAAVVIATPLATAEQPPRALYRQGLKHTVARRGGVGREGATNAACEDRNVVERRMAAAGG